MLTLAAASGNAFAYAWADEVPAGFAASQLDVRLRAEWLVCREVCIPQGGEFAIAVPSQAATAGHAALFAAAWLAAELAGNLLQEGIAVFHQESSPFLRCF